MPHRKHDPIEEKVRRCRIYIIPIILAAATALSLLAGARSTVRPAGADASKSRFLYYQGLREMSQNNNDAAYEYFNAAVHLDPDNADAAMLLAPLRMYLSNPELSDSAWRQKSLDMMRRYVDRYPDDIDEGLQYALIAGMNDTMPEAIRVMENLMERQPDNTTVLAYLSQAYARNGNPVKAVEALDRFEAIEGRNSGVTLQKMSLLLENRDTVGAMRQVQSMIDSNPADYTARILKGNLFDVMNLPDSAENEYETARRMAPTASEPMVALMDIYRSRGDSAAYDNMLYEVLLTDNMDIQQKSGLLSEYLQHVINEKSDTRRGDYLFDVLRSEYPHEPEVMNLAARYSAAKSDFASAAEQIQYALDMDRKNPELWQQLIFYLANANKYDDAVRAYEQADSTVEMTPSLRLYGGMLLQNSGRNDDAMALYRRLLAEVAPDFDSSRPIDMNADIPRTITLQDLDFMSSILTSMGDCAYNMNDSTAAFLDYRNALEIDPDNSLAANNYAYFMSISGGDLNRAYELSQQSLRGEQSDNPTYIDTNAWILYLRGDYKQALEQQKRAIELMEKSGAEDVEALEHFGDILIMNDQPDTAIEYWQKALKLDPARKELRDKIERTKKELKQ